MGIHDFQRLRAAADAYVDHQLHPIAKAKLEQFVKEKGGLPARSQIHGLFRRSLCARDPNLIFDHAQLGQSSQSFEAYLAGKRGRELRRQSQAGNQYKALEAGRNYAFFDLVYKSTFEDALTAPKRVAQTLFKRLALPSGDKELRAKAQVMLFEAWMSQVFAHALDQLGKIPKQHHSQRRN